VGIIAVPTLARAPVVGGGVQGNIYDQSFNSGDGVTFNDGGGNFLVAGGWHLDSSTNPGAPWTQSIRQDIAQTGANTGLYCYYGNIAPDNLVGPSAIYDQHALKKLYVRWFYKESNPFDYNGTTDHANIQKFLRFYQPGINNPIATSFEILPSGTTGVYSFFSEVYDSSGGGSDGSGNWFPNCNLPAPTPNSYLGQWHCFEIYVDISDDAHHVFVKFWLDGVLYTYHDFAFQPVTGGPGNVANSFFTPGNGTNVLGDLQFFGTWNAMASASKIWLNQVGVSTIQMGVPTVAYN